MSEEMELPFGKLADSAYRAFLAACEALELRAMEPVSRPWLQVVDVLANNDGVFTVAELGEHVRQLYLAACELPADEVDTPLGQRASIAWQAVGLHLYNLIQGGGEGNLRELESSWASWAREQLSPSEQGAA